MATNRNLFVMSLMFTKRIVSSAPLCMTGHAEHQQG